MKRNAVVGMVCACVGGVALFAGSAQADIVYSYSFGHGDYELSQGESVWVPVYLEEKVTGGDLSVINAENGLATAGAALEFYIGSGFKITGISGNPAFSAPPLLSPDTPPFSVDMATLYSWIDDPAFNPAITEGVSPTSAGTGIWRVWLGSFEVTATGTLGDTATAQLGAVDALFPDAYTYDAYLNFTDPLTNSGSVPNSASVNFSITAVPEPASLLMLAGGLTMITLRRKRNA